MLSIAICDDDVLLAESLNQNLVVFASKMSLSIKTEIFGDGQDLLDDILYGSKYDIIFLDIEMKYLNGLETAKRIREVDTTTLLIYITSHTKYAVEAYSVRPFQFIVKPFDMKLVEEYFQSAIKELETNPRYFRYLWKKKSYKIAVNDIVYFESQGRKILINTIDNVYTYNAKLNNIEIELTKSGLEFWRIHQSYLVNRKNILEIEFQRLHLVTGDILPISEDRRKLIREKYLNKIGDGIIE